MFFTFCGSILAPKCGLKFRSRMVVELPVSVFFVDKILRIQYVFIHFGDMPNYTLFVLKWVHNLSKSYESYNVFIYSVEIPKFTFLC